MVIGGLAVAIWGEPRATRDADIKVQLTRRAAPRLLACLPEFEKALDDSTLVKSYRRMRDAAAEPQL